LAFTSTVAGSTATIVGDGGSDTFVIDSSGGLLRHNRSGDAGFNSAFDWDSATAGDQTLAVAPGSSLVFSDLGGGDDEVVVGTASVAASSLLAAITITSGGSGDDALVINDGARVAANTYSYNDGSSSITATGININTNATFESGITLIAGSGSDTINVVSTFSGTPATIFGGDGDDVFNITATGLSTNSTHLNGQGGNDTFNLNGLVGPSVDLNIDGGSQTAPGGDSMTINAVTVNTVRHFFDTASSGRVEFDLDNIDNGGLAEVAVNYVGLEPIADNASAVNRVFDFGGGDDSDVVLRDAPGVGLNVIEAPANAESVTFANPTASLTVNLGSGNDTIDVRSFDPGWVAPTININGGDDQDEIRIGATPAGTTTNVDTQSGNPDRTIIGRNINTGNAISFAQYNTGLGTLDAIAGAINVNDTGGVGQLFVDDSGDAGADVVAFTSTTITGAAPAVIGYNGAGNLTTVQLALGTGGDTVNVASTAGNAGNVTTTIFGNGGDDSFVIAGDGLQDNNVFRGDGGQDSFALNIAANLGAGGAGITSLQIEGNAPAGDTVNRDRITINDNNAAAARTLNYHYVSNTKTAGDMDIEPIVPGSGLAGAVNASLALLVRTMETIVFNAAGAANDLVRVTGTTATDVLTAALLPTNAGVGTVANSSALVFLDGAPYLNTAPVTIANSRPGVAGGGSGPDVLINGIAPATGLLLDGNGFGATGDRAVVYAASENSLVDVGNPTNIFGFGAGVLQPGFGVGNAYDTITVNTAAASTVATTNNAQGALVNVRLNVASFVQPGPASASQQTALIVDGGDEAAPQASGIADNFNVSLSPSFNIQVNGNLPTLTTNAFGQPLGDQLNVTVPGSINVFSDAATPPNVSVTGLPAFIGPFGVQFSSIERSLFTPTNGIVNIIGDNNDPNVTQNDYYKVRGTDVDFNPAIPLNGQNEFTLQIGGNWDPATGTVSLSSPIFFKGVTRINAVGGAADRTQNAPANPGFDSQGNVLPEVVDTGVDALDIRPFADNTPRNWGIETYFNEGDPVADGGVGAADLLIFNGVAGVSDKIVVQPSASQAGQVIDNNAASGTPIAVVNYVLNTNIIVNGNDGSSGDTDTLTLRGTDGTTPLTSGNETVVADFDAAGTPVAPRVVVTDTNPPGLPDLYTIQSTTNIQTINFELGNGNDDVTLLGPAAANGNFSSGVKFINVLGGANDDTLTIDVGGGRNLIAGARVTFDGGLGSDSLTLTGTPSGAVASSIYTPGPAPGSGRVVESGAVSMVVDFANLEPVVDLIPAVTATVNGTNADDTINLSQGSIATRGLVSINDQETYEFAGKTNLIIEAGAGKDNVILDMPSQPTGLTTITVNGGAADDIVTALNVPDAEATTFTRVTLNGGAGNDRLDASAVTVETPFTLNGGDGNDTLAGGSGPAADQYIGGAGDDLFIYTPGNDSYEGDAGIDTLLVSGTNGNDQLTLNQSALTTLIVSRSLNGAATQTSTNDVGRTLEIVRVEANDGDDLIAISVSDSLITPGPPDTDKGSLAFRVIGGGPNASDRLNVRDDGQGDLVVHRQAADGRSGSIRVGPLQPVDYEGIEFIDITPLDPVTGRTGNDGTGTPNGQLVVFHADQLESNPSRLVATPLGGAPTFLRDLNIDPGPVDLPQPFDPLPGDEDWFEFRPPKIGTYRFETLFQQIPTLPSGRQGLPGNGNLQIEVRSATGALIDSLTNTADNKSLMISMAANTNYFLRVRGVDNAINVYDLNITEVDLLGPQVFDPDGAGGVNAVHITDNPSTPTDESLFDLSTQKGSGNLTSPTPLITSLTVHLRDPLTPTLLLRQPGDVYPALDATVASQPGLYVLVGDSVGRIPISNVIVTNNPVAAGEMATATVVLQFAQPLPDDRYTLTILDSLTDPPGNRADGESNSSEPQSPLALPSGNGISGGSFQQRFTVDSRPELANYAGLTVVADMNGNGSYDLANPDATNRDMQFLFGEVSDQRFAGKFALTQPGFDVLAAYGRVNGTYRFLIDKNGNGGLDPGESIVSPAQVNALAVAGNFDGNAANGDEIALFDGVTWRILSHDLGSVVSTFDAGLRGYPLAGDFDGDGITDLATYQNDQFFFNFGNDGFGAGVQQLINFGAPGIKDRPVAADMDGDGITDIGLWIPRSGTDQGTPEWRFIVSNDLAHVTRIVGSANTLIHPFSPVTLGHDLVYHFGDSTALPLVGNFDPPLTATPSTAQPASTPPAGGGTSTPSPLSPNQALVASLYHDILGRAPDPSGWSFYTSQLNTGVTRDAVAQTLLNSPERLGNVVDSMYDTYLHRTADPAGRQHWIQMLVGGATEDSVATGFMLSAEYSALHASDQSFVDGLYHDILARGADAGGRASHLAELAGGQTRAQAVAEFLSSNERYTRVVDQLYGQAFGRHADATGLAWYLDKLKTGQYTPRTLAQTLLASDEYFAKFH
jgi:hypothetical protein